MLQVLLESRGLMQFHCAADKGRTGVASAILLTVLGIRRSDVIQDYVLTNDSYLVTQERFAAAMGLDLIEARQPGTLRVIFGAHVELLDTMFAAIDRDFGSFDAYLHGMLAIDVSRHVRLQDLLLF